MNVHFAYDNMTSCDKHIRVLDARRCKIDTKKSLGSIQIQAPLSGSGTVRYCRTERRVRYLRLVHRHIYCFRYRRTRRTAAAHAKADDGADEKYFITVVAYQSYCWLKVLSLLQSTTGAVYGTSRPRTRHGRAPENIWARLFSFYKTMRIHAGVIFRPRDMVDDAVKTRIPLWVLVSISRGRTAKTNPPRMSSVRAAAALKYYLRAAVRLG